MTGNREQYYIYRGLHSRADTQVYVYPTSINGIVCEHATATSAKAQEIWQQPHTTAFVFAMYLHQSHQLKAHSAWLF